MIGLLCYVTVPSVNNGLGGGRIGISHYIIFMHELNLKI